MKTILLGFISILVVFVSCKKQSQVKSPIDGDYTGIFYRTKPSGPANPPISHVTMHFENGKYSGSSDSSNYPILCQGNFTADENGINAVNTCFFTANIDWTYIFDGHFGINYDFGSMFLIKRYPNGETDTYMLVRKP